jgi:hypothetical protein
VLFVEGNCAKMREAENGDLVVYHKASNQPSYDLSYQGVKTIPYRMGLYHVIRYVAIIINYIQAQQGVCLTLFRITGSAANTY